MHMTLEPFYHYDIDNSLDEMIDYLLRLRSMNNENRSDRQSVIDANLADDVS